MVSAEAAQDQTVEGQADQTEDMDNITGLMRQYLQWITKEAEEEKDRTGCSNGRAPSPGKQNLTSSEEYVIMRIKMCCDDVVFLKDVVQRDLTGFETS